MATPIIFFILFSSSHIHENIFQDFLHHRDQFKDPLRPDPDSYRPDPEIYRPDPEIYRPDPDIYRPDPDSYRPAGLCHQLPKLRKRLPRRNKRRIENLTWKQYQWDLFMKREMEDTQELQSRLICRLG
jgi:hypothetical protein